MLLVDACAIQPAGYCALESDERVLQEHDTHAAVWVKLKAFYLIRLATLQRQNDSDLSEKDTIRLRGRIAEIKFLLALGDTPDPDQVADE